MEEDNNEVKKGNFFSGIFLKILPYVLMIALGAGGGIYTAQQRPQWFGLTKGTAAVQAEVDALVAQVGKLMALPTDEKPTIATVTDASKVKDQPFFANAKNDDRVLIYQKAQKAILFRPSENRIIEVGSLNINQNQTLDTNTNPQASSTPSATPKAKE